VCSILIPEAMGYWLNVSMTYTGIAKAQPPSADNPPTRIRGCFRAESFTCRDSPRKTGRESLCFPFLASGLLAPILPTAPIVEWLTGLGAGKIGEKKTAFKLLPVGNLLWFPVQRSWILRQRRVETVGSFGNLRSLNSLSWKILSAGFIEGRHRLPPFSPHQNHPRCGSHPGAPGVFLFPYSAGKTRLREDP
jgi:hypothetical protein